jgi:hypothetical protein
MMLVLRSLRPASLMTLVFTVGCAGGFHPSPPHEAAPPPHEAAPPVDLSSPADSIDAFLESLNKSRAAGAGLKPADDYGPQPPADYLAREKAFITARLKDPESAHFQDLSSPGQVVIHFEALGGAASGKTVSGPPIACWLHVIQANAKNGFGGYVGFKPYAFAWKNGIVICWQEDVMVGTNYWLPL